MSSLTPSYQTHKQADQCLFVFVGEWILGHQEKLHQLKKELLKYDAKEKKIMIDLKRVHSLDTLGAWIIKQVIEELAQQKYTIILGPEKSTMVDFINQLPEISHTHHLPTHRFSIQTKIEDLGRGTIRAITVTRDLFIFLGEVISFLFSCIKSPQRIRLVPTFYYMEKAGLDSLPIVGLITFLVGIVLAYLGSIQLEKFGATILTVNLVAVAVLREIGILLAAIMIAGRSGSAFTAQIGTMKIHEEIDALKILGLHPFELLVIPRILGLVLVMPLITFWADIAGIVGGGVISVFYLDLSVTQYIRQFQQAATLEHFMVGMIKAPFFAFVIALVGCFEGFRVHGSADSIGEQTTRSVVEAIFLVIVLDAIFAVFFSYIGY